jgi:hypothetical protein
MSAPKKMFLFIDESGDHGLTQIDINFPIFVLCGVLISQSDYERINNDINDLKKSIWGEKKVIFHSRDIRKCDKEFQIFFDIELKEKFYINFNHLIANESYTIFASAIRKDFFIHQYGKLQDDVYEVALSFLVENAIMFLRNDSDVELDIIIEKRGRREDKQLSDHFRRIAGRGTGNLSPDEIISVRPRFLFKEKKEDINGLQIADLFAYPIARFIIDPLRANPAFDILRHKIYKTGEDLSGLRVYP